MPFLGTVALVFCMASLGLPGLGNFVAEFLTLIGAWKSNPVLTIFATIGLVVATAYSLRIMQKIFYGGYASEYTLPDLSLREKVIMVPLVVVIVWLGVFPQPVLNTTGKLVTTVLEDKVSQGPPPSTKNEPMLISKDGLHE
jgi:NADH-quinone oxidoreductase subunit M